MAAALLILPNIVAFGRDRGLRVEALNVASGWGFEIQTSIYRKSEGTVVDLDWTTRRGWDERLVGQDVVVEMMAGGERHKGKDGSISKLSRGWLDRRTAKAHLDSAAQSLRPEPEEVVPMLTPWSHHHIR